MRFSVCLFAPAKDLLRGGVLGMDRHKEGRTIQWVPVFKMVTQWLLAMTAGS